MRTLEALAFLSACERDITLNPTERNAIQASLNLDAATFTGTYAIPCQQTIATTGGLAISAVPYLTGVTFSPGSGERTLVSTTIEAYCLECLQYLQWLERQSTRNPDNRNYVTGTYNDDTGVYSGSFTLPVSFTIEGTATSGVKVIATPYLT